ncbi:MAG TPA: SDR family NAD(P)-dependent oxidoreductase [Patescibacteria group bacterium]|jgi:short-subunit dehydrogenase
MSRTIVITGGTGKLGRALAGQLKNDAVVLVARNAERLKQIAAKTGAEYQAGDAADPDQALQAATDILKSHKTVDVLINASGGWIGGPYEETAPEDIQQQIRSNALAPMLFTREIYAAMKEAGAGRIVNVVSQGGFYAERHQAAYAAAKFAMDGFTKSLAKEAREHGVTVGGIYPGAFGEDDDSETTLNVGEIVDAIEFVIGRKPGVNVPELGIQAIKYGTD